MPRDRVVVRVTSIKLAAAAIGVRTPRTAAALHAIGTEIKNHAIEVFEASDKGRSTPPFRYKEMFGVRTLPGLHMMTSVFNKAPTAVMVEYGAHAASKTRVLGYAPFRRAIDITRLRWARVRLR